MRNALKCLILMLPRRLHLTMARSMRKRTKVVYNEDALAKASKQEEQMKVGVVFLQYLFAQALRAFGHGQQKRFIRSNDRIFL